MALVNDSTRRRILSETGAALRVLMPHPPAGVVGCFVYGSVTRAGAFRDDSDIDVAMVFAGSVTRAEALKRVADLNRRAVRVAGHPVSFTAMQKGAFGWFRHLGGGVRGLG